MDAIREDVSALTLLAEVLCLLDMIVNSFAHSISTKPVDRYSRPELTGSSDSLSPRYAIIRYSLSHYLSSKTYHHILICSLARILEWYFSIVKIKGNRLCNIFYTRHLKWNDINHFCVIYLSVYWLADSGPLAIDAGRHPILESIHNDFVVSWSCKFSWYYHPSIYSWEMILVANLEDSIWYSFLTNIGVHGICGNTYLCVLPFTIFLFGPCERMFNSHYNLFQPNSIFMSEASNMLVVMGPNM